MKDMAAQDPSAIAREIIQRLEDAWNAADGAAFGAPFAEDADFVTIRGEDHQGRAAIAGGHQGIFDTIYRGSAVTYTLLRARLLADDVVLAHASSALRVPSGPLAGEHNAVSTLALARGNGAWQIAAFHNTLVAPTR
jgi:uncharacterized protein (TIGR02246 family)